MMVRDTRLIIEEWIRDCLPECLERRHTSIRDTHAAPPPDTGNLDAERVGELVIAPAPSGDHLIE
jgi:hypothetical protein